MTTLALTNMLDRARLSRIADGLMIAVVVSMPWSTSATSILLVLWLLAFLPTLEWRSLRAVAVTPAGGLPVALVLLGVIGMLWANVSLHERWEGLESFLKLLIIPLLMVQFRSSDRGLWALRAYLISCLVLLLASSIQAMWPYPVLLFSPDFGVPVKNAPTQSGEFVTCIFGMLYLAYESFTRRQWLWVAAFAVAIMAMLVNIIFVATGRTALVIIPILLALFAFRMLSARGIMIVLAAGIALGTVAWFSSPYLRARTHQIWTDIQKYEANDERNSSGERIEFAKKSLAFIREAPFIGHGTGSIHALFTESAIGRTGPAGVASTNPHNQTFAVAIQLGLLGTLVMWAMWLAHLLLFRGSGLAEWVGFVIVVQNIVGSFFNSHLFDFAQGWVYVLGVGIAGGMVLKARASS